MELLFNFVRTWHTFPKHLTVSYSNVQIPMSVSLSILVIVCFYFSHPSGCGVYRMATLISLMTDEWGSLTALTGHLCTVHPHLTSLVGSVTLGERTSKDTSFIVA